MAFDKIVLVTRKTRLEELVERFNTRAQAKFYIEHAGGDFADYEREDDAYRRALDAVRRALSWASRCSWSTARLLPDVPVRADDLVVTLGPGRAGRQHRQVRGRAADRGGQPGPRALRRRAAAVPAGAGARGDARGSRGRAGSAR